VSTQRTLEEILEHDPPTEVRTVTKVHDGAITMSSGWSIGCTLPDVQIGDVVLMWGRGVGFTVRGLVVGGRIDRYRTEDENREWEQAQVEAANQRRRDDFEKQRPELDRQFAQLPEAFQRRIARFREAGGPDWRWEYEPYEMMVCVDAVKIAEFCLTEGITIGSFAGLPWDEQKRAGISDGHSGNSFSAAVHLARLWPNPDAVVAEHGALVPLVGCEAFGCHTREVLGE
jgi:hypothetical protein